VFQPLGDVGPDGERDAARHVGHLERRDMGFRPLPPLGREVVFLVLEAADDQPIRHGPPDPGEHDLRVTALRVVEILDPNLNGHHTSFARADPLAGWAGAADTMGDNAGQRLVIYTTPRPLSTLPGLAAPAARGLRRGRADPARRGPPARA